jgi:hypothetical protein
LNHGRHNCTQQKYDHRLRNLVRSTGDIGPAIRHGVPRSTARGWLTATNTNVITVDVVDRDTLRLQQEVLALRKRNQRLIALLRIFVVLLKVSGFSVTSARLAAGPGKRELLRAMERSRCALPLLSPSASN